MVSILPPLPDQDMAQKWRFKGTRNRPLQTLSDGAPAISGAKMGNWLFRQAER
jgi:hypothetical protein